MSKLALLMSGGIDSTALLINELEKDDFEKIIPHFCCYGSKLEQNEYTAVKNILCHVKKYSKNSDKLEFSPYIHVHLNLGTLGPSRLTYGLSESTTMPYLKVHPAYVPARDPLMVLHTASAIEHDRTITHIGIGIHRSDAENQFPDCTYNAIHAMNMVLLYCLSRKISLYTPFANMTKDEIVKILSEKDPEVMKLCFSGYGDVFKGG